MLKVKRCLFDQVRACVRGWLIFYWGVAGGEMVLFGAGAEAGINKGLEEMLILVYLRRICFVTGVLEGRATLRDEREGNE